MIDEKKIEAGIRLILEGIGEDTKRPGLIDTPHRIANMYKEIYGGLDEDASVHLGKTFPAVNNELVLEKDITFYSTCEHHLLPFYGKAHIAYIPDGKVVGLSKLARTVDVFAKRPQIQEQMTAQIGEAIMDYLKPKGVMVIIQAEHMCMTMRGIKKPGSQTVTYVCRGDFENNPALQQMVFQMVKP
jgi:GTP cyclohydrolase I